MEGQRKKRPFIKEMSVEQAESNKKKKPKRSIHGKRRLGMVAIGLCVLFFFVWKNISNHAQIKELNNNLSVAQSNLEIHQDYKKELEENIALLENEEYVADIARSEYYLTHDDEIVFNFVDLPDSFSQDMNEQQAEFEDEKKSLEDQDDADR